ncbi:MAG: aml 2 [Myxococcales bacterium]|nr:aml 2 [Myxococcales bacterium]
MTLSTDDLIAALRLRYDYYSAQSMFELACERAELAEKPTYEVSEVKAWRTALVAVGDRLDPVLARLDALVEAAPAKNRAAEPATPKHSEPATAAAPTAAEPAAPTTASSAEPTTVAGPASEADVVETTIVLTGVEVADGEEILVCGAFPELGDWDPERARPMSRTGDEWLATIKVAPETKVPFKFLRRTADGNLIWESGADRSLVAKPRLEQTWR